MDAKEIQKRLNVDSISVINAKAPVNLITEALGPVDSRAGVTQGTPGTAILAGRNIQSQSDPSYRTFGLYGRGNHTSV